MSHFLASSEAQDAFWNISSHGGATVISPLKQKTDNLNAKTLWNSGYSLQLKWEIPLYVIYKV